MVIPKDLKSASSGQAVPTLQKLDEALRQFQILFRDRAPWRRPDFSHLGMQFQEYDDITKNFGGFKLTDSKVFEIGCGQRPHRLFYMIASGVDAYGIDMDKVIMSLNPSDIRRSYEINGIERTLKTALRHVLFDKTEHRHLQNYLSLRAGKQFDWPLGRITFGSAADPSPWPDGPFDFVYSEDVFEHIPAEHLVSVCRQISRHLSQRGVAFIRPMVFTGIQGGHNVEWYNALPGRKRKCGPWDHLRKNSYPSNTYLNKLGLADYRKLFSQHFKIVEEKVRDPSLGRAFMTPELREELRNYPDEELYSNHVSFVLKRRPE